MRGLRLRAPAAAARSRAYGVEEHYVVPPAERDGQLIHRPSVCSPIRLTRPGARRVSAPRASAPPMLTAVAPGEAGSLHPPGRVRARRLPRRARRLWTP